MNNQIINVYNAWHLGDNILNFICFYNIKKYIEQNNIIINYYCSSEYHEQLAEFNCSNNINIIKYEQDIIPKDCLHLWIGNADLKINWTDNTDDYDIFLVKFFNQFLERYNIHIIIEKLEYEDPELLERYARINAKCDNRYNNIDILVINSDALSGQYNKDETQWNEFINKLNKKYKIVTAKKVPEIPCTLDDKLTVKDIAAISTKTNIIIAINTGVITGLFNTYTLNNVQNVYTFDNSTKYSFPKFKKTENINDLQFLLNENFENFENNKYDYYDYLQYLMYFLILLLLLLLLLFIFFIFYTSKIYTIKKIKKYL